MLSVAIACVFRCPKDAAGPQCEYMLSGLHKFPPTRPPLGPSKECEHRMIEGMNALKGVSCLPSHACGTARRSVVRQCVFLAKEEYQKSVILVAGIAGFLILALLIAFFLYVKKR